MEELLVVMAKAPIPGQVKTRLTPALSINDAAELSVCFLKDRLTEMAKLDSCNHALAFTPRNAKHLFRGLVGNELSLFPQKGMDLGERMSNIFVEKRLEGYEAVVVIGTDSPDLPRSIVSEAFTRLQSESIDVVFGPAADGGYYLVGTKQHHPKLFKDIPWGTGTVLGATLKAARASGIRTECLQTWNDIDTIEDIRRFYYRYKDLPATEHRPGATTLAYLANMKEIRETERDSRIR